MNNRWRRRFYLDEKRKIKGDVKEEIFLTRKFYDSTYAEFQERSKALCN